MFADFQWQEASILAGKKFGLTNFEYGVVPMPYGPNNTQNLNIVHSAGWAIGQGSDCPAHVGKLIDMLVDGHAAAQAVTNAALPAEHVALYTQMASKPFCVNTRDSAIGGGYDLANAVADGKSISQAIEEFKPEFQRKVNEANGK
jgi:ABC-type glycerol-3-phosphate transport system substrate-binding protein